MLYQPHFCPCLQYYHRQYLWTHSMFNKVIKKCFPFKLQLWDVETEKCLRTLCGHSGRVGSLAWNSCILTRYIITHFILVVSTTCVWKSPTDYLVYKATPESTAYASTHACILFMRHIHSYVCVGEITIYYWSENGYWYLNIFIIVGVDLAR